MTRNDRIELGARKFFEITQADLRADLDLVMREISERLASFGVIEWQWSGEDLDRFHRWLHVGQWDGARQYVEQLRTLVWGASPLRLNDGWGSGLDVSRPLGACLQAASARLSIEAAEPVRTTDLAMLASVTQGRVRQLVGTVLVPVDAKHVTASSCIKWLGDIRSMAFGASVETKDAS